MSVPPSLLSRVRPAEPATAPSRTIIVSNRLPVTARIVGNELTLEQSSGGLATGLRGVHQVAGGLWIGWSGLMQGTSAGVQRSLTYRLGDLGALSVSLSRAEVTGYYQGYCNNALWPVLHDHIRSPAASGSDWACYQAVNARYADLIAGQLRPGDRVWVHDFHLLLLPRLLRERCPDVRVGFFLHTPFPPAESFAALSQASTLLDGVLGADLIGFHTRDYARNFTAAVRLILGYSLAADGTRVDGRPPRVLICPMGIDVPFFTAWARKPAVIAQAAEIRAAGSAPLFVGIDRLDYTKGIEQRLLAFERLLESRPDLRPRLIQVAVPSREDASGYAETRRRVEELVTRINRRHAGNGWTPLDYHYGSVDTRTLVALYRAADVMLVTPLCDGLNLVAKEFVACREDEDGVLVLSSCAGAASELDAAVLTDPHQLDDLVRAYRIALEMSGAERRLRMRHLRLKVESNDVFQWSRNFLEALEGAGPRPGDQPDADAGQSKGLRLLP
jgi:trehalose 6-phosphate synthase/phosphatase